MSARKKAKTASGFTIVELLVVIAVIAVLAGLLFPAIQSVRETGRRTECLNHCRQIGMALQGYQVSYRSLPPGWISETPVDRPGWGWASLILPYLEQDNLRNLVDYKVQFSLPAMSSVRTTVIPLFLCPSDTAPEISRIDFIPPPPPAPFVAAPFHDPPSTDVELFVSKSNYSGVFGTTEIEPDPANGTGVFFRNSRIRTNDIKDGLSSTIIVGERRGDLGTVTWVGVEPLVVESAARIVATTDHTPNHPDEHFEDFHSAHREGVHFVFADCSTRMISNDIDPQTYRALATRAGGEIIDGGQ